uniref:Uncharacterized protein n=1 Tax=Cynoglossus semilaevis TaxID=244447 RepID=A0A3P8V4W3_CYNSE
MSIKTLQVSYNSPPSLALAIKDICSCFSLSSFSRTISIPFSPPRLSLCFKMKLSVGLRV